MPVLTSETSSVLFGEQSAFRTPIAAASASRWIGVRQIVEGIFPEIDWKAIRARGGDRDVYQFVQGKRVVEGTLKFNPQLQSLRILKYAMGSVAHSGAGDPFTHTISGLTGAVDLKAITLRRGYQINATQEVAFYVRDCIVDSMEISGGQDDILEVSLGIKGGKPDPARATETILVPTKDQTKVYSFKDISSNFTLGGTSTAMMRSFRYKVANNGKMLTPYQSTDPDYPYVYVPGTREYTLECEFVPIDDSFIAKLDAATPSTTATWNAKFTGQTGPERSLELKGNAATIGVIKSAPHSIPEEAELMVPVSMQVDKAQLVVLDGLSGATWDAAP